MDTGDGAVVGLMEERFLYRPISLTLTSSDVGLDADAGTITLTGYGCGGPSTELLLKTAEPFSLKGL